MHAEDNKNLEADYFMMKRIPQLAFFLPMLVFSFLTACATTPTDPAETYKGQTAQQIFHAGEEALRDRNYMEASKRFEALDVQYPFDASNEKAQLHIIYAYYMNSDYAAAEAAADRFIHLHPANAHVDYAYYLRGLANYYQNLGIFERVFKINLAKRDLAQIKKSYADFAEIVRSYPQSRYAPAAHQQMIYLRNILAEHELQVAEYYYGREAYVAAADRANLVVRHYQGAPVVPDALVLMLKSYRALHLVQDEKDVQAVLRYNYPDLAY